ncbi:E3 ubiquitin-protein ligase rnf146 [Cylas formicarius]|uniref:E3 ubiquitin-protein ligase rnf146 n=1 Tax=Cylas formicarius TaxID=197179 RepID=UPI002958500E|nr:E3 ubiquitin-protein ligase rnf146 [Cylas formicarius]
MAESEVTPSGLVPKVGGDTFECAVCLQPCVHPAQLPCGHIFCYLCVKGFANQNKKCAICRQEIPRDFIEQPQLLDPIGMGPIGLAGWFYEGRNGWWQYDERTSKELEASYKRGEKNVELLIAGFLYIIDFENMIQLRRNDPSRRRLIKRDLATIPKKGIAGLRTDLPHSVHTDSEASGVRTTIEGRADNLTPITPSNTPQSPTSGRDSPNPVENLQVTVERISNLRLDSYMDNNTVGEGSSSFNLNNSNGRERNESNFDMEQSR